MTTLPGFITWCHHGVMSVGWFIICIVHGEDVLSLFNRTMTDFDTLFIGEEGDDMVKRLLKIL
jgi:hypothetical protein